MQSMNVIQLSANECNEIIKTIDGERNHCDVLMGFHRELLNSNGWILSELMRLDTISQVGFCVSPWTSTRFAWHDDDHNFCKVDCGEPLHTDDKRFVWAEQSTSIESYEISNRIRRKGGFCIGSENPKMQIWTRECGHGWIRNNRQTWTLMYINGRSPSTENEAFVFVFYCLSSDKWNH